MTADEEDDATGTTVTVSEHNLGHDGHPSFQSRYTRRRMMRACGADDVEVFFHGRCSENYVFR
jgi:hypothetical protein